MNIFSRFTHKIKSFWSRFVVWVNLPRLGARSEESEITTPLLSETTPVSTNSHRRMTPGSPTPTPVSPEVIALAKDPLSKYLSLGSLLSLSLTCTTLFKAYEPNAAILASHVLWNRWDKAKMLLEAAKGHPEKLIPLLQNPVTVPVELPSGHHFQDHTPFQAALCTGNEVMCALFKSYFEQIPNGLEMMQTQIGKIFPEGIEDHIEKQKKEALKFKEETLRPLITTISAASLTDVKTMLSQKQADSALGEAIAAFREEIKKLSDADPVYNRFYLQEAFDLYLECFYTFTTWDQRDLFSIQVIGLIQCYSSAADLQAFAQGLYYLVDEGKPFRGSFKFTHVSNHVTHLEIKMKDFRGLGFDYLAVAAGSGCAPDAVAPWVAGRRADGDAWKRQATYSRFLSNKNSRLYEFCAGITAGRQWPAP